jgi:Mg-chelatase subunit ChlD
MQVMFNREFKKFLISKPSKEELYPYLYSIAFKELGKPKKQIKKVPIKCTNCEAVFTDINLIKEDAQKDSYYICEFCGTINSVDKSQIKEKLPNDIDFLLEALDVKIPKEDKEITKVAATEGDLYISVIDISGSMSGAKIEAVKKSLVQTLKDFKVNSPTTKYILIAFESSVYYYLSHDKSPINFTGDLLFTPEGMKSEYKKSIKKEKFLGSIGEFADGWVQKVEDLRSMDMTALGPALYFAIISFESFDSTGRITLLTDGLANQGIGNLSGTSPGANKFYEDMADLCNQFKIIVDVVGVSASGDNNEMGLQVLGTLTDKTGGTLYLISSEEMEEIFTELRQMKYIGKDVKVKIIVPPSIMIKNVTGAYSSKGAKGSEISLGAITEDRELFLELESSKVLEDKEEVPVQLQVEYLDNDGNKRMRVINDKVMVTKDENEFKSQYDQKFNVMMNIQTAGGGYYAGKGDQSKKRLKHLKDEMMSEMRLLQSANIGFAEEDFTEGLSYLDDELEEIEMEEKEVAQAPAKSYWAAKGQKRARMSTNALKKRMEKKEKK